MTVAIIHSGCANINSVRFAIERLGKDCVVTRDPAVITAANKVILPGVGAARHAMENLADFGLIDCIQDLKQPVLGICLGLQLLYDQSEENNTLCLGIIEGQIIKLPPKPDIRVPHMGWNTLDILNVDDPLFNGLPDQAEVYFVHSYFAPITNRTISSTRYGTDITACVRFNNFWGCQFHPERSGKVGAQLLKNFLERT